MNMLNGLLKIQGYVYFVVSIYLKILLLILRKFHIMYLNHILVSQFLIDPFLSPYLPNFTSFFPLFLNLITHQLIFAVHIFLGMDHPLGYDECTRSHTLKENQLSLPGSPPAAYSSSAQVGLMRPFLFLSGLLTRLISYGS